MASTRRWLRRCTAPVLALAAVVTLVGCPPSRPAERDGGTACSTDLQCNPAGNTCGIVYYCIASYCSISSTVVACGEGGYPDAGPTGNCATYQDCNPLGACGAVIDCIDFRCANDASVISVPCGDGGGPDGAVGDAADADASGDAVTGDTSPDDANLTDAASDGG